MITGPSSGAEIILPGRQDNILFSGAPNLIVTLSPPFILTTGRYSSVNEIFISKRTGLFEIIRIFPVSLINGADGSKLMGFIFSVAVLAYVLIICIPCAFFAFTAYSKKSGADRFWLLSVITLAGSILLQSIYVYWPYINTHSAAAWSLFYSTIIGWHSLLILIFTVVISILSRKKPILRGILFGAAVSPLIWLIITWSGLMPVVFGITLKY